MSYPLLGAEVAKGTTKAKLAELKEEIGAAREVLKRDPNASPREMMDLVRSRDQKIAIGSASFHAYASLMEDTLTPGVLEQISNSHGVEIETIKRSLKYDWKYEGDYLAPRSQTDALGE